MTNEEYELDIIERYLNEKLTPEEEIEFKDRLSRDENFANSYHTYKELIEGIRNSGRNKLLQQLKKVEASLTIEENFRKKLWGIPIKKFYSYSAAATIALLISFTFIFIIQHRSTPRDLYSENFEAYPNVVLPTTRGSEIEQSLKDQAFYFYDLEEYNKASKLFEKLYKEDKSAEVLLYLGNSYMVMGKFDQAIITLEELIKKQSEFKSQGLWYLSLSYLAKNNREKAKKYLEKLSVENVSYSKKARKILNKIQ